ncbi:hypothetical protein AC249_AIPGENE10609 [Exaiptasia diaphana]|nr:hypothetical protein AC249_AIPGENE10609 [Exaiptasia diaphana]
MFSRERKVFQQKMKAIYGAFIFEQDIKAVRQVAIDVDRSFEDDNIKPAKWYKKLSDEAESLTLNKDKDINHLIEMCYPFALEDIHSVSFLKAKLCLLIQSMPLYELCSIPMQDSLHFIMTNILEGPSNLLNDWMGHRKLQPLPATEQKPLKQIK